MKATTKHELISNPKNIICIGLNYADHIAETSLATHNFPEIFMKTSNALASHQDTITIEDESFHYDYEGELVIVIGKAGKNISHDQAKEHILGYTIGNDVSARALQFRGSQWILGKSLDNFAPIGPIIVSPDDFDFENATITTTVNGEVRQQAKLQQMLFKPYEIIELYPSILHYKKVTSSLPVHLVALYLVKTNLNMVGLNLVIRCLLQLVVLVH